MATKPKEIPALKDIEAEEFLTRVELNENNRIDFSKQIESMRNILKKSKIN